MDSSIAAPPSPRLRNQSPHKLSNISNSSGLYHPNHKTPPIKRTVPRKIDSPGRLYKGLKAEKGLDKKHSGTACGLGKDEESIDGSDARESSQCATSLFGFGEDCHILTNSFKPEGSSNASGSFSTSDQINTTCSDQLSIGNGYMQGQATLGPFPSARAGSNIIPTTVGDDDLELFPTASKVEVNTSGAPIGTIWGPTSKISGWKENVRAQRKITARDHQRAASIDIPSTLDTMTPSSVTLSSSRTDHQRKVQRSASDVLESDLSTPPSRAIQRFQSAPPHRRLYAFNASTPEEEIRRASMAEACEGLSSLCSQWHTSEYNKSKFGAQGCPVRYCPMTIVAPDHVTNIMTAQAIFEKEVYASQDDLLVHSTSNGSFKTESSFGNDQDIDQDQSWVACRDEAAVICTTPELIDSNPDISRDTSQAPIDGSWVACEEEDDLMINSTERHNPSQAAGMQEATSIKSIETEEGYEGMGVTDIQSSEIQLNDGQRVDLSNGASDQRIQTELRQAMEDDLDKASRKSSQAPVPSPSKSWTMKTSDTHPINVSFLVPPQVMPTFIDHFVDSDGSQDLTSKHTLLFQSSAEVFSSAISASNIGGNAPIPIEAAMPKETKKLRLGNLLLSSCPGKKVRLDGPVQGRSAICRDLKTDLARIKEMGVGCIICCLDDDELRYLGAPWEKYKASAAALGLLIVRIPMPEGLTPASLVDFDEHVDKVIRNFTLKGIDVLAHCRAGVGRAGLTACAWAVKMGIVGPSPELEPHFRQLSLASENGYPNVRPLSPVECESARVMSTVERVICLIRRRRSMKAIETFEQVNFLASYIAWLRKESQATDLPLAAA